MSEIVTLFPPILKWARQNAKFTHEQVLDHFSQKTKLSFGITSQLLGQIETAPTPIRVALLKELARLYTQPLAVFFLQTTPPLDKDLEDLRTLRNRQSQTLSPAGAQAVREARRVQMISAALGADLEQPIRFQLPRVDLGVVTPRDLALRFRADFGLTLDKQRGFNGPDDLFVWLRGIIEDTGVVVLKEPFPLVDALGFSLTDEEPFVITVNSKWGGGNYAPKIFSLLHEYAHVLLRSGGICNDFVRSTKAIETFCNRFAAAFLIPIELFRAEVGKVIGASFEIDKIEEYLVRLGEVFKASKPALLLRFVEEGMVSQEFFDAKVAEWNSPYQGRQEEGIPFRVFPHTRAVNSKGIKFAELVIRATTEQHITRDAAAGYLNIQPTELSKVAKRLKKRI